MLNKWLLIVPPPVSLFERIRWRAPLLTAGTLSVLLLPALGVGHAGASWLGQGGTVPPALCFSQTQDGTLFEFLGYETAPDGTTTLSVRLTNPHKQPAPQVQIAASGWTPVAPADGSVYAGESGTYGVQWFPRSKKAPQTIFRFVAQGDTLRDGTSDTFHLTVRNFDPQTPLTAWTKAGPHRASFSVVPAEHGCDLRPTPTPTPTVMATPAVPTLLEQAPNISVHILQDSDFGNEWSAEEKQTRWEQGLPVPEIITLPPATDVVARHPQTAKPGLMAPVPLSYVSGWTALYSEDFEGVFPIATEAYRNAFTEIVTFLVDYYDNRIGYWEVWNEPDYSETRLTPASFATLLQETYDAIKAADVGDLVVLGGMSDAQLC